MSICINPNCRNPKARDTLLFCPSCGSELLLDGRYRTVKQLGEGGFGKTYEVIDCSSLNSFVETQNQFKVLKVLIHNNPKYVELFQREAQTLAQLNHPGIPLVEPDDYFTYQPETFPESLHCLVMEKIEGLNLAQYLKKRSRVIKEKRAIEWLIQLVTILKEIHNKNFFHRDIKPSNIMLRANGQLVLIDFGAVREITKSFVSKQADGELTGVISAGYTPIEQMHGQSVPQSDFFALGRSFVYLLTGKKPSEFYDSINDKLNWREHTSNVSTLFADFLDSLMARNPRERPQTAVKILQELTAIYHTLYPKRKISSSTTRIDYSSSPAPSADPTQALNPKVSAHNPPIQKTPLVNLGTTNTIKKTKLAATNAIEKNSASSKEADIFYSPLDSKMPIQPDFVSLCQKELAELIGPMASIICKRTLEQNPKISGRELVEKLAQKIPNQQQAEEFKKSLLN